MARMAELMDQFSCDILGGECYDIIPLQLHLIWSHVISRHMRYLLRVPDRWFGRSRRYFGKMHREADGRIRMTPIKHTGPVTLCDYCSNFFMADTVRVRRMGGWNPLLKVGEHEEFFMRAREAGLRVGHSSEAGVRHLQYLPAAYRTYRERASQLRPDEIRGVP
jgi:hypothetical protein